MKNQQWEKLLGVSIQKLPGLLNGLKKGDFSMPRWHFPAVTTENINAFLKAAGY